MQTNIHSTQRKNTVHIYTLLATKRTQRYIKLHGEPCQCQYERSVITVYHNGGGVQFFLQR